MSTLTIYTDGSIYAGGTDTGYGVKQTASGTEIYCTDEAPVWWPLYRVEDGEATEVHEPVETDGINSILVLAPSPQRAMAAALEYEQDRLAVENIVWHSGTIAVVTAPQLPPIELPHPRYSLAHDAPASGVPGRKQFEEDFLAALRSGGKTQAQICADRLSHNGVPFQPDDGRSLAEVADEMGAIREYGHARYDAETETRIVEPCARSQWIGDDPVRFVFPDGSAIVEAGCAWDLEGPEPFSWANE